MQDETNIGVRREADPSVGCLSPANGGASVQEVSYPGPGYSKVVLSVSSLSSELNSMCRTTE